jgi:hypothetical protein
MKTWPSRSASMRTMPKPFASRILFASPLNASEGVDGCAARRRAMPVAAPRLADASAGARTRAVSRRRARASEVSC